MEKGTRALGHALLSAHERGPRPALAYRGRLFWLVMMSQKTRTSLHMYCT